MCSLRLLWWLSVFIAVVVAVQVGTEICFSVTSHLVFALQKKPSFVTRNKTQYQKKQELKHQEFVAQTKNGKKMKNKETLPTLHQRHSFMIQSDLQLQAQIFQL